MGMKILWQVESRLKGQLKPGLKETYLATRDFAQQVARPDTEIIMRFMEDAPTSNANHLICHSAVTTVQMIHSIVEAEREGFDAAFSGVCMIDVWSRPCRQAVKIPVLGGLGSAMMLAQLVGIRFAIVAVNPIYLIPYENKIRELGWEKRALSSRPVRTLPAPAAWDSIAASAAGNSGTWLEMFDDLAYEFVQEGADVIICGCNPGAAQLALNGYREVRNTGVPVIYAPAAMVKLAEMMVDLRRSINLTKSESQIGMYQSLAPEMLNELHALGGRLFE